MKFNFYSSNLNIKSVKQEKWLLNKRAVFLELDTITQEGSVAPERPTKILFDYKSGEIYVVSTANLWRTGNRTDWMSGHNDWMTEEEFQEVLEKFEE